MWGFNLVFIVVCFVYVLVKCVCDCVFGCEFADSRTGRLVG